MITYRPPGKRKRVAVLGAGILGCSLALMLARRGHRVALFDAEEAPFRGASRWNEGKIHLGYLYAADPTLGTAKRLLSGGLAFRGLVEALIGCSLEPAITPSDDMYLVHRDSVVDADAMCRYFDALSTLVRGCGDAAHYLVDVSASRPLRLSPRELGTVADTGVVRAGFRVPERSVSTNWVADRYLDALRAEPAVEWRMRSRVRRVLAADGGCWRVVVDDGPAPGDPVGERQEDGDFAVVVNALWQGRLLVDASVGLAPEPGWSHRYRQSLFVRTRRQVSAPSAVLATGPFGDVKNYNGRDFYLSWYPHGLRAQGEGIAPPVPDGARRDAEVVDAIAGTLGAVLAPVRDIMAVAEDVRLEGGWVFAMGRGELSDPASGLHRRDRFGIRQHGSYFSVDTGKYSTAPTLAMEVAARLEAAP